jgi:hypothetical protein
MITRLQFFGFKFVTSCMIPTNLSLSLCRNYRVLNFKSKAALSSSISLVKLNMAMLIYFFFISSFKFSYTTK